MLRNSYNTQVFISQVAIPSDNHLVQNATHPVNGSYTGLSLDTLQSNLYPHYSPDYTSKGQIPNFSAVFGVLFSGVTGIMAGTSMSGKWNFISITETARQSLFTHYCPAMPFANRKKYFRGSFSSVVWQSKQYHPSGILKFNNLGIFQSLKFCILIEKPSNFS